MLLEVEVVGCSFGGVLVVLDLPLQVRFVEAYFLLELVHQKLVHRDLVLGQDQLLRHERVDLPTSYLTRLILSSPGTNCSSGSGIASVYETARIAASM